MNSILKELRSLPGIHGLEARLDRIAAHPNPHWAPDMENLEQDADQLSQRLFGVSHEETFFTLVSAQEGLSQDQFERLAHDWDRHFAFLDDAGPQQMVDGFVALGWDVSNGEGQLLKSVVLLARQLVVHANGLRSQAAWLSNEPDQEMLDSLEASLAREALAFRSKPKPKPKR